MAKKSYLTDQIKLISLKSADLFTEQEYKLYEKLFELTDRMNRLRNKQHNMRKKCHDEHEEAERLKILEQCERERQVIGNERRSVRDTLTAMVKAHKGKPRTVLLRAVLDTRLLPQENGEILWPKGITWRTLKTSRRIAEFVSDASRALGVGPNEVCMDKIILKWKSIDLLEQIVLDGFFLPILMEDGTIEQRHFRFETASAGQLRTDKLQCLSDRASEILHRQMDCGLDWETINRKGGVNVNKLMAYTALSSSATDPWPEMDIDRCVVIPEFKGNVTGTMQYIRPDYSYEVGEHTVTIDHTDGCGMVLPSVFSGNAMVRGRWLKGLLSPFDFLRFCDSHNISPEIEDVWGQKHNLREENIEVCFTDSQLKTWKLYDSWDDYKEQFKRSGSTLSLTNYEENWIPDTTINYQMLQTLTDFTDEELEAFTARTKQKIENLSTDLYAMLQALKADENSVIPYRKALRIYPDLLREAYSMEALKSLKKRMILDAKSGRIKCLNKRLFAIPDLYACCERWFLGIENPKGLLEDGEVYCRPWQDYDEVDCLRSPHLYMEHAIRKVNHSEECEEWFQTNGVYTSCHDLISRILQFDKSLSLYGAIRVENMVNPDIRGVA